MQSIRDAYRQHQQLCVECVKVGVVREWTQLDHIVALGLGGDDAPHNRQGLCDEHHATKTAADLAAIASRNRGAG